MTSVNWRLVDLSAYFFFVTLTGVFVGLELWWVATIMAGTALLQLTETVLHALGDAVKEKP